jgi:hypothetical protein
MLGMLLVNFLGNFEAVPRILKHSHDYCSYADTIMPQFLFAAGFSLRLSLSRRLRAGGGMPWGRAVRRISGLATVAIVWYSITGIEMLMDRMTSQPLADTLLFLGKRHWMQTLMHIALTSLWILPVVVASSRIRVAYAVGSGLLHAVLSWWFNFSWVNANPMGIDGGPLGFLTWSIPALCGTLACDALNGNGGASIRRLIGWGAALMAGAWILSIGTTLYNVPEELVESMKSQKLAPDPVVPAVGRIATWDRTVPEPPFVPPPNHDHRKWNYWMMSQRCGTVSYTLFSAGFACVVLAVFVQLSDRLRWQSGLLRTFGTNSLAAYILHDLALWVFLPWLPENSSLLPAFAGFVGFTLVVYAGCRLLELKGWYLRV